MEDPGSKLQKIKEHLKRKSYLRDDEDAEQGPHVSLASATPQDNDEEYVPLRKRKEMQAQAASSHAQRGAPASPTSNVSQQIDSLLAAASAAASIAQSSAPARPAIPLVVQAAVMRAKSAAAAAPQEIAPPAMIRSWIPPAWMASVPEEEIMEIRRRLGVTVNGDGRSPVVPVLRFADLRLPPAVYSYLSSKKMAAPTSIQAQVLPLMFAGRDLLAIAPVGSGKSMAIALHLILAALEAESRLPLEDGEGPVALLLVPSREVAKQSFDSLEAFSDVLSSNGLPRIHIALCTAGSTPPQTTSAVHIVVATMGRLIDTLRRGQMSLAACEVLAIDEAERVLDQDFKEDMKTLIPHFRLAHQTVLFASTAPRSYPSFASAHMISPVMVHHLRPLHELDVVQEVAWVRNEAKNMYLLECLQKTPPPAMVIVDSRADAEQVYEFLLRNHVNATLLVGSKEEERESPVSALHARRRDVLVTTDGAIKGVQLPDFRQVIGVDMPKDVDSYVQRMCHTGTASRTGLMTTFINHNNAKPTLLALKRLLIDTEQRIPGCLDKIAD